MPNRRSGAPDVARRGRRVIIGEADPYGLPRFPGEELLTEWADHSDIALRTVRVFTAGSITAVIIAHPGVWDVIVGDGRGGVRLLTRHPEEIAETLRGIAAGS